MRSEQVLAQSCLPGLPGLSVESPPPAASETQELSSGPDAPGTVTFPMAEILSLPSLCITGILYNSSNTRQSL